MRLFRNRREEAWERLIERLPRARPLPTFADILDSILRSIPITRPEEKKTAPPNPPRRDDAGD